MITIEQLEIFEHKRLEAIQKFANNHPYLTFKLLFIATILVNFCILIILMLALVGQNYVVTTVDAQFASGNMTLDEHDKAQFALGVTNYMLVIIAQFIVPIFVAISVVGLFYLGLRFYLIEDKELKSRKKK